MYIFFISEYYIHVHEFIYHRLVNGRRQWDPTPVLSPGQSHGWRSLAGCSPWGRQESDTTERLHFHFSLSCIGEGNGSPLQCSCLENPRDGGAWWAAVCGVAQSRTRLKRLSGSSELTPDSQEHGSYFRCCSVVPEIEIPTPWLPLQSTRHGSFCSSSLDSSVG